MRIFARCTSSPTARHEADETRPSMATTRSFSISFRAFCTATPVQLLDRERRALLAVLADRAEEARERDELPDADGLLRAHDGGEGEWVGPGRGAGRGEGEEVASGETRRDVATLGHRVTS